MTRRVALLENPIQDYDWGSRTALAELLGREPSLRPQAELWMGAHPRAPSRVRFAEGSLELGEWIERDPDAVLGRAVVERFGPRLPFLFKVLAVERALSIQVHPDARQAAEGFAREQAEGMPLDAAERCYRDPSPKPELVCALTPFRVLRGFRPVAEIREAFRRLGGEALALAACLDDAPSPAEGLRRLLDALLGMPAADRARGLAGAVAEASKRAGDDPACAWVERLAAEHPGDPGALAPLYLRLFTLAPGEAMFLPAGELHAYLHGTAVELMANSDNVLRGGLTHKRVDPRELMRTVDFAAPEPRVLRPEPRGPGRVAYRTPARDFELEVIAVEEGDPVALEVRSASILLCTEGAVWVEERDGAATGLPRGSSCLVPAAARRIRLEGAGRVYRASVPD